MSTSWAQEVYICAARRTALGSFGGAWASYKASDLAAQVLKDIIHSTSIPSHAADEVILGQVLNAGAGQAPVRQAARAAGLPDSVKTCAVNRVCGSALQAVVMATHALRLGAANVVMAGGMESMSQAPHLLPRHKGKRPLMGSIDLKDHMLWDGLTDAYEGHPMGHYGEISAQRLGLSRKLQDEYALESYRRAQQATEQGYFKDEITAITSPETSVPLDRDEEPFRFKDLSKIHTLRPLFAAASEEGTVTAGNASSLSDGAAALLLASQRAVEQYNLKPLVRCIAESSHAGKPQDFPTAPIPCIQKLLHGLNYSPADVDLWEINEAFAAVSLAAIKQLHLSTQKVNVHGGAVSLGHPIGCSGARILVTLIHALKRYQLKRGVAALCIGGGEAIAVMVENISP